MILLVTASEEGIKRNSKLVACHYYCRVRLEPRGKISENVLEGSAQEGDSPVSDHQVLCLAFNRE